MFTSATEATTHLLRLYKIDNNSNTLWQRDLASSATANAFQISSADWYTPRQVLLTGISSATALAQLPTYISVGHPADDRSIDWPANVSAPVKGFALDMQLAPSGFICDTANVCTSTCGDGIKAPDEGCDDANTDNEDGCNENCQLIRV